MSIFVVKEESELASIVPALLAAVQVRGHILALRGDLGAGKTALTKTIARILGVTEHVTSPTFVIMKSYAIPHHDVFTSLTHIDAYRIEHTDELRVLGFEELVNDPKRLLVIEWPERIQGLIPENALTAHIVIEKEGERSITYGE